MNKKRFLYITACIVCISFIVLAQSQKELSVHEPVNNEAHKIHIRHLIETAQYDSATRYCNYLRKHDSLDYDELEKALATIAWTKGDKPTAYQYVVNSTDYLLRTNAGRRAFTDMLYDYDYAYPLATDTFLEKMVIDKVSEFYSGLHDFPQATAALKFMLLNYRLKKLYQYNEFLAKQHMDAASFKKFQAQFKEEEDDLTKDYIDEIKQNDKLLTWKEAGAGFETQYEFLEGRNDAALHMQMKPYFEKAFNNGEIHSDLYVDQLVWLAAVKEKDDKKLEQLHDSLCVLYKCLKARRVYPLKNGDSVVIHDVNRFGKPQ